MLAAEILTTHEGGRVAEGDDELHRLRRENQQLKERLVIQSRQPCSSGEEVARLHAEQRACSEWLASCPRPRQQVPARQTERAGPLDLAGLQRQQEAYAAGVSAVASGSGSCDSVAPSPPVPAAGLLAGPLDLAGLQRRQEAFAVGASVVASVAPSPPVPAGGSSSGSSHGVVPSLPVPCDFSAAGARFQHQESFASGVSVVTSFSSTSDVMRPVSLKPVSGPSVGPFDLASIQRRQEARLSGTSDAAARASKVPYVRCNGSLSAPVVRVAVANDTGSVAAPVGVDKSWVSPAPRLPHERPPLAKAFSAAAFSEATRPSVLPTGAVVAAGVAVATVVSSATVAGGSIAATVSTSAPADEDTAEIAAGRASVDALPTGTAQHASRPQILEALHSAPFKPTSVVMSVDCTKLLQDCTNASSAESKDYAHSSTCVGLLHASISPAASPDVVAAHSTAMATAVSHDVCPPFPAVPAALQSNLQQHTGDYTFSVAFCRVSQLNSSDASFRDVTFDGQAPQDATTVEATEEGHQFSESASRSSLRTTPKYMIPTHSFTAGDAVGVWSNSTKKWFDDGKVVDVTPEGVEVHFGDGLAKVVLHCEAHKVLCKAPHGGWSPSLRTIVQPAIPAVHVPTGDAPHVRTTNLDIGGVISDRLSEPSSRPTQYVPWGVPLVPAHSTPVSHIGAYGDAAISTNSSPAQLYPHARSSLVVAEHLKATTGQPVIRNTDSAPHLDQPFDETILPDVHAGQSGTVRDAPPAAADVAATQLPQAPTPSADASPARPVSYAPVASTQFPQVPMPYADVSPTQPVANAPVAPMQLPQASADASPARPVSYAPSAPLEAEQRKSVHAFPQVAAATVSQPAAEQRPRAATAPAGSTQHTFMRQVTADGSAAQTVLTNPDGSQRVFGETTVESLVTSTEGSVERWFGSLGDFEIRALVHEMGQRLIQGSKKYHANKQMLEEISEQQDLSLFGLEEGAGEEELDKAYRRKAREMHPDKNGGTDEAKEEFQAMRSRYENLKKKRRSSSGGCGDEPRRPDGEENDAPPEPERKPEPEEAEGRPALEKTAWKMISQLKAIRHNESIIEAKFNSVRPKAASA